jgi:hypothetical protein
MRLHACLLLVLAGTPLAAQSSHPPLDAHFENDQVILNGPHPGIDIPEALIPPDVLTHRRELGAAVHPWHDHQLNRVMVYIFTGGEKATYLDGVKEDMKWEPGTVKWSAASGYHFTEPPDWPVPPPPGPMIVDIGIKKAGYPGTVKGTALDPLRVAPRNVTLVLENSQVRVLRLTLGPRQSVPMHEYTLKHLVVFITDQNVRMTSPEGKAEVAQYKAGNTIWDGPSRLKLDNLNDKPLEAVVVEFKSIY